MLTNPDLERLLELVQVVVTGQYTIQQCDDFKQLKEKIEGALEHVQFCNAFVLTGEDARKFEEYNNREPTNEEIERMKEADRIYALHNKDKQNEKIVDDIRKNIILKLQETIKEEQRHIDHPKQIYKSVDHNCRYNQRLNELLLDEFQSILEGKT